MTTKNTDKGQAPTKADSQGHCALGDGSAEYCDRCGKQFPALSDDLPEDIKAELRKVTTCCDCLTEMLTARLKPNNRGQTCGASAPEQKDGR